MSPGHPHRREPWRGNKTAEARGGSELLGGRDQPWLRARVRELVQEKQVGVAAASSLDRTFKKTNQITYHLCLKIPHVPLSIASGNINVLLPGDLRPSFLCLISCTFPGTTFPEWRAYHSQTERWKLCSGRVGALAEPWGAPAESALLQPQTQQRPEHPGPRLYPKRTFNVLATSYLADFPFCSPGFPGIVSSKKSLWC